MIVLRVATPWLSITAEDEDGNEYVLESWHGGYATLFQHLFDGRYRSCVNVSQQQYDRVIPEPNATVVAVWTMDGALADDIDARDDMAVLLEEEVSRNGERPAGW